MRTLSRLARSTRPAQVAARKGSHLSHVSAQGSMLSPCLRRHRRFDIDVHGWNDRVSSRRETSVKNLLQAAFTPKRTCLSRGFDFSIFRSFFLYFTSHVDAFSILMYYYYSPVFFAYLAFEPPSGLTQAIAQTLPPAERLKAWATSLPLHHLLQPRNLSPSGSRYRILRPSFHSSYEAAKLHSSFGETSHGKKRLKVRVGDRGKYDR